MMLELAREWNLRSDEGLAYGIFCGYAVTLIPGDTRWMLSITTQVPGALPRLTWEQRQTLGIRRYGRREFSIRLEFAADDTLPQRLREFLPDFLGQLSDGDAPKAALCPVCGQPVMGRHPWMLIQDAACHLHPECIAQLEKRNRSRLRDFSAPRNWKKALLGGSLGGILGALLWIALAVGWGLPTLAAPLVPCLVWLGWLWGDGQRSWAELGAISVLSLVSLLAGAALTWLFQPKRLWLRLGFGLVLMAAVIVPMCLRKHRRWAAMNEKFRMLA